MTNLLNLTHATFCGAFSGLVRFSAPSLRLGSVKGGISAPNRGRSRQASSGQDEDASLVVYCRGTKPGEKTLPEEGVTAEASNPRDDIAGCVLADLQIPDLELSAGQFSTVCEDIGTIADKVA